MDGCVWTAWSEQSGFERMGRHMGKKKWMTESDSWLKRLGVDNSVDECEWTAGNGQISDWEWAVVCEWLKVDKLADSWVNALDWMVGSDSWQLTSGWTAESGQLLEVRGLMNGLKVMAG